MDIHVSSGAILSWTPPDGGGRSARCALGRGGIAGKLREGDGVTPLGAFPLRRVWYRGDRMKAPLTDLPMTTITRDDGWCDDADCDDYNRPVTLPHDGGFEKMWRDDGLYDVVVEIGYNDAPVAPGLGSAIFLHIAHPDYKPTEGCVAVRLEDMLELLVDCDETTSVIIG